MMKELLTLMKNCTYTPNELIKFEQLLITKLGKFPSPTMTLHKGRSVYRCRKHNLPFKPFHFESDFSFRTDIHNINSYGRCNLPNSSVFYGSIISDEISDGFVTSIFETTGLNDYSEDTVDNEGYEMYTFGMWRAKEDIDLFVVPPEHHEKNGSSLHNHLVDLYLNMHKEFEINEDLDEFYTLLGKEFGESKDDKENSNYGLTSIFANTILNNRDNGLAYPSVKAKKQAYNVCFNPNFFSKNFELVRVGVGDLFKFKKDFHFRHLYVAEISDGIPLVYKDVPKDSYTTIDQVIAEYKNKGIDEKHIIRTLMQYFTS